MVKTEATTHWNQFAEEYDNLMNCDRSYLMQLEHIMNSIDGRPRRILDLGCGTGAVLSRLFERFPEAQLVGLDPAEEMLHQVQERFPVERVTCVLGSADELDFADESFDYVVSNWALHHLTHEQKEVCAAEVFRVLCKGGKFINGDQFAEKMGPVHDLERAQHILELLSKKAQYYLNEVSFERMLLQVKLMPKFLLEDGECMSTPEYWLNAMKKAGFTDLQVLVSEPAYLMNRVLVARKPGV